MRQVYEMEVITRTRSVYGIVAGSEDEAKKIASDVDFFDAGTPRRRSKLIVDVRRMRSVAA